MERRDQVLLLLLLGGAGYAVHANWDEINERLGLDDLAPGRVRAIELAKEELTFDRHRPNWMVIQDRREQGQIELEPKCWDAEPLGDDFYRVNCIYRDQGRSYRYAFRVNIATGRVEYIGDLPAAPR